MAAAVAAVLSGCQPSGDRGVGFLQITSAYQTRGGDTYVVGPDPVQEIEGGGFIDIILKQPAQTASIVLRRHGAEYNLCNVEVVKGRIVSVSLQKTFQGIVCVK